jgi:hypothetical protein
MVDNIAARKYFLPQTKEHKQGQGIQQISDLIEIDGS